VDEAASKLRIEIDSLPTEIDVVERRIRSSRSSAAPAKETDEPLEGAPEPLERELANLKEQSDSA
jgi:ATP-dependent Clp protease ATP-binding subunit ClpB